MAPALGHERKGLKGRLLSVRALALFLLAVWRAAEAAEAGQDEWLESGHFDPDEPGFAASPVAWRDDGRHGQYCGAEVRGEHRLTTAGPGHSPCAQSLRRRLAPPLQRAPLKRAAPCTSPPPPRFRCRMPRDSFSSPTRQPFTGLSFPRCGRSLCPAWPTRSRWQPLGTATSTGWSFSCRGAPACVTVSTCRVPAPTHPVGGTTTTPVA